MPCTTGAGCRFADGSTSNRQKLSWFHWHGPAQITTDGGDESKVAGPGKWQRMGIVQGLIVSAGNSGSRSAEIHLGVEIGGEDWVA